jgi:two-component system, sensor histidine kinase PdtaS
MFKTEHQCRLSNRSILNILEAAIQAHFGAVSRTAPLGFTLFCRDDFLGPISVARFSLREGANMLPQLLPEVAPNVARALIEAYSAPALLLDQELKVVVASTSFCGVFQIDPFTIDGRSFAELDWGKWNMSQLPRLLKATASGFAAVANYEVSLERKGQSDRCLVVNATKLNYAGEVRLLLSIADNTDARNAEKLKADLLSDNDILLQELNHRFANSLQIIASILMQSARTINSDETRNHLHDAHQRVMSMAALQRQLAGSKRGDVELRPFFSTLCDSITASMIHDRDQLSLVVAVDDSITAANTSASLGLITTELIINALKHAFPENRRGRILVGYRAQGSGWALSVEDDGVGMPNSREKARVGLGTSIVEALSKQLGAEIKIADTHPGTKVSIARASGPISVAQAAVQSSSNSAEDKGHRVGGEPQEQKERVSKPDAAESSGYSKSGRRQMNFALVSGGVGDPELEALYAYWIRQCVNRPMPRRADINPKGIVSLLPQVFIVDICQPLRFRFRLVGSAICDRWHDDLTGKWLDELKFDGELKTVLQQYASVARTGIPRVDKEEFVNEEGRYLHYRRLLLPLSEDGQKPNMLIGIQKAIGIDGYKIAAPNWM